MVGIDEVDVDEPALTPPQTPTKNKPKGQKEEVNIYTNTTYSIGYDQLSISVGNGRIEINRKHQSRCLDAVLIHTCI